MQHGVALKTAFLSVSGDAMSKAWVCFQPILNVKFN